MIDLIGLGAAGDPRIRSTWSGTPTALVSAFEDLGIIVQGFSGQIDCRLDNALYAPTVVPYGLVARQFRRFFGPAHHRNVRAFEAFRQSNADIPVVHTDHMWLNSDSVSSMDYLYRDVAWSDWARTRGLHPTLAARIGDDYTAILEKVGHVFVVSDWAKERMIDDGAPRHKVSVVGTGVGNLIGRYEGVKDYHNGVTLCIAKVRHHDKGLDLLLEGFKLARRKRPELELHLVVPSGSVPRTDGVKLHSDISGADLTALYEMASVYAMPARNEPYGLVYLEAQLSRTVILGARTGAFPEFAAEGKAGFLIMQTSAESVAEALLDAHSDPARLERMGRDGQSRASLATWERTAKAIVEVIASHHEVGK